MYFWTFLSSDVKRKKNYGQFEDNYRGTRRGKQNKTKQNAKKIKDPLCLFVGRDPVVHLQQTEKMVDCEINTLEIKIITFFLEMTGNIHLLLAGLEKVL